MKTLKKDEKKKLSSMEMLIEDIRACTEGFKSEILLEEKKED